MNKQQRINSCLRLVSSAYRLTKNDVRLNTHNCFIHETAKYFKVWQLLEEGREVYTEVIFKNGKRCDVLIPELFLVYEILYTETKEEALKKIENYPKELEIVTLEAWDVIDEMKEKIEMEECFK